MTSAADDVEFSPTVKVAGSLLDAQKARSLIGVRVELGLNVVGRASLRFDDEDLVLANSTDFQPGKPVEVATKTGIKIFSGTIVGVTLEQLPGERPHFVVVADDAAYKLTLSAGSYTYLSASYSDVVSTIAKRAGLSDVNIVAGTGPIGTTQDYLIQAGSDLGYIDSIAERFGYVWYVDPTATFNFVPAGHSSGDAETTLNEDLWEFSVRASALRPTEVSVSGWDVKTLQTLVGQGKAASVYKTPSDLVKPFSGAPHVGTATRGSAEFSPADQQEASASAAALLDNSLSAAITASGVGYANPDIGPAVTLNVQHAGPASGKYLVTETQHVYDSSGWETRFVAGSLRPDGLVDMLGRPAADPGFVLPGLVIGLVTNNADPDNLGRVKVQYVSLPQSNIESTWARVLSTSGGKNRGIVFMPEINDEVLVGFEGNDLRHPVVLGALFSSTNSLPESSKILRAGSSTVDYRRITSRLNHIIELADGAAPDEQHILFKLGTQEEHSMRLGADKFTITLPAQVPLTIKCGIAEIGISGEGDIDLKGKNISIQATESLSLQGATTSIKGMEQLQAQGATISVKADMEASVEAGLALKLNGGVEVAINS